MNLMFFSILYAGVQKQFVQILVCYHFLICFQEDMGNFRKNKKQEKSETKYLIDCRCCFIREITEGVDYCKHSSTCK